MAFVAGAQAFIRLTRAYIVLGRYLDGIKDAKIFLVVVLAALHAAMDALVSVVLMRQPAYLPVSFRM